MRVNKQWKEAAEKLIVRGYVQSFTTDPLLPVLFWWRAESAVYLYAPGVAGRTRPWVARPVSKLPKMFGLRDVAEHFGLSLAHVKHEVYALRLVPSQRIGLRGALLCTPADVAAWSKDRPALGRPRTEKYRSRSTLEISSYARLMKLYQSLVDSGEISPLSEEQLIDISKEEIIDILVKKESR